MATGTTVTAGDMFDTTAGKLADPLWLFEGSSPKAPIAGIDDCEDARDHLSYRSENGNLSKFLKVSYRDNTSRDINLDDITADMPNLSAAKQEALNVMGTYNTMFMMTAFQAVFFIITMQPTATSIGKALRATQPSARWSVNRVEAQGEEGTPVNTSTSEEDSRPHPHRRGAPRPGRVSQPDRR